MRGIVTYSLFFLAILCYGQVDIGQIPDQTIGLGGKFNTIQLDDFSNGSNLFWETQFLKTIPPEAKPEWKVNSADFQFNMNITASVISKGLKSIGNSHQLAVYDNNGVIKGVANATAVGDAWVYFMTVYSDNNGETLHFKFFDDSLKQTFKAEENLSFNSNQIIGQPDEPFAIHAANIKLALDESQLNIFVSDSLFTGTERIRIIGRSLSNPNNFDADTIALTVVGDFVPTLSGIPTKISNFQEPFSAFDLDDFTTLSDADPVIYSFSGNTELDIDIDVDNIVTITKPTNWSGLETITFTITDVSDNAFSSSEQVIFRGKPTDQAPVITHYEDQTTGLQGLFETIDLSALVTASNPESIAWDFEIITDSIVDVPDWNLRTNEFQFNMSATIEVSSLGKILTGSNHTIAAFSGKNNALIGKSNAIEVNGSWYYFLTIYNNESQDSVYFKIYDKNAQRELPANQHLTFTPNEVIGDPLSPFRVDAGYLFPSLNKNELSFSLRATDWKGTETLKITAIDTETDLLLNDKDTVNFIVLDAKPPVLAAIDNKFVQEGNVFSDIELSQFLSNVLAEDVTWTILGADTLMPALNNSLLSFNLASEHYFGIETMTVKAISKVNSSLFDVITFDLTTTNINDAPIITTTPISDGEVDELYRYDLKAIDYDNDQLTIEASNLPDWLYAINQENQTTILGIPTSENAGLTSFSISVKDGLTTTTQNIDIAIAFAEMKTVPPQTVNEGQDFLPIGLSDFVNILGDITVSWSVTSGGELDATIVNNVLQVTSSDDDWYGQENITLTMIDSKSNVFSQNVLYTKVNVNDAPIITSTPTNTGRVNVPYRYDLTTLDIDNPDLTITVDNPLSWLTFVESKDGGAFIGTPAASHAGTNSFEITVSDGELSASQTVEIFVSYAAFSTIEEQTILEGATFDAFDLSTYLTVFGDINTYWQVAGQNQLTAEIINTNTLTVTTPNSDWFGSEALTLRLIDQADDQVLDEQIINFTVTNVNDAPTISSTPTATGRVNVPYRYDLTTLDIDNTDLTVTVANPLSWITFVESKDGGAFIGTPSASHAGTNSFQITVSDGELSASQTVEIFVSYAAFSTIEDQTILEGATFDALDLNSFLTVFGDITTYWEVAGQNQLTAAVNENTLTVTTPNSDWFGSEALTLRLIDQADDQVLDEQIINFIVTNVNDAPTITSTPTATGRVNVPYRYDLATLDIDNADLTITVDNPLSWLTFVESKNGGAFIGTPAANHAGTNSFQITVSDGELSASQTVEIFVSYAAFSTIEDQTILEGAAFDALDLSTYLTVFGDINTYWQVAGQNQLTADINVNTLTVTTPNSDWFGSEALTLRLIDQADDQVLDEQIINFTITNVNDAPTISSTPPATGRVNVPYRYDLSTLDIDNPDLTVTVDNPLSWLTFVESKNGGAFIGTPAASHAGTNSFEITVSDGELSASQTVEIFVSYAAISTIEDQTIIEGATFDALDLSTYLTVFGDITTYWQVAGQNQLTAGINVNTLTVATPNSDWFGSEALTLRLIDQADDQVLDEQIINFTVTNVNDAPTITSTPTATGRVNVPYRYDLTTLDIDNTDLTVTVANPLSWITFVESKDGGAFIGTPSASHAGTNSFQITVSDGGLSASQTVEIFVSYAAFTTIEDQTIIEGATFDALDLSTYLTVFGDINTYWQVAGQNQLTAAVSENTLTVTTPNSDWFGNETLTVNLVNQDNDEVLDSQEVTYQVNNVNDAPVITSTPTSTASIGVYYTYAITAQDVDGDALTLSAVNLPSWLTFVAGSNGATVLGKPSIEDAGNHQFQISLTDGAETIMQDVTILVASASIQGLEGQVIEEGNSFASIDLNNFVAIFGDISISWEVSSGQELIPTIDESNLLSVAIPNEDWFGSESFTLSIVDSNLTWDETVIIFTVNNVNDAPVLTVAPNTNAVKGEYFETKVEYFDADNDLLSFELIDAPSWLSKIDQSSGFTLYGIADDSENLGFEVKVSDNSSDIVLNIVLEVVTILSSSTVQDLEAYPNPTINRLNFNASQDVTHIQVIDMFGRIMLEEKSSANYIDVDQLSEGQYLLRYVLGGESKSMKFIKK